MWNDSAAKHTTCILIKIWHHDLAVSLVNTITRVNRLPLQSNARHLNYCSEILSSVFDEHSEMIKKVNDVVVSSTRLENWYESKDVYNAGPKNFDILRFLHDYLYIGISINES